MDGHRPWRVTLRFDNIARISRIQDSLHAHIVRSDRAGIDTVVVVVVPLINHFLGKMSFQASIDCRPLERGSKFRASDLERDALRSPIS